jgi:hypothetical protein
MEQYQRVRKGTHQAWGNARREKAAGAMYDNDGTKYPFAFVPFKKSPNTNENELHRWEWETTVSTVRWMTQSRRRIREWVRSLLYPFGTASEGRGRGRAEDYVWEGEMLGTAAKLFSLYDRTRLFDHDWLTFSSKNRKKAGFGSKR